MEASLAQLVPAKVPRKKKKLKQTKLTKSSFTPNNDGGGSAQGDACSSAGDSMHANGAKRKREESLDAPESEEANRKKLVGILMKTFAKNCGSAELARCQRIEDALHSFTESMGAGRWREYRLRARSIIFNLKASDGALLQRVRDDDLSPEELVRLKAEDLASDSLKAERLMERERYFKSEIHVTERIAKRKRDTHRSRNAAPERSTGDNLTPNDYSVEVPIPIPMQHGQRKGMDAATKQNLGAFMPPKPLDAGTNDNTSSTTANADGILDALLDEDSSESETTDSDDSDSDSDESSVSVQEELPNLEVSSTFVPPVTAPAGDEELARALEELSSSSSSSSSSSESEVVHEVLTSVPSDGAAALVEMLVAMGFDADKASCALQSASGDLSRAVAHLCEA
jgi:hypothetical protein